MSDAPLISIIIPVYKTEAYLQKCLESVAAQTYPNLEIILVDDGSPDGCPEICDRFAAADPRFRVLHKPNGGVSSARNAGLALAKGAWIGWVDSDDWADPDMFASLMDGALTSGADIVVCGRVEEYKDHRVPRGWNKRELLSREAALEALLHNDAMQNFLWDKLWRRALFDGLAFPEGRTFEDIALMHTLFERAETVLCLPETYYHYLQRQGSIVDDSSLGNRINHYLAARLRLEDLGERWPQFRHLMAAQCVASSIGVWSCYYANPRPVRRKYHDTLKELAAYAEDHYRDAEAFIGLGGAGRLILRLTPHAAPWAFALARLIGLGYKQRHGREL